MVAAARPGRSAWGPVGVAAILLTIAALVGHGPVPWAVAGGSTIGAAVPVPCDLAAPDAAANGTVSVDGGPWSNASELPATLAFSYIVGYETVSEANGTPVVSGCERIGSTGTSDANGSFSLRPTAPPAGCGPGPDNEEDCTNYTGPYGPVRLLAVTPDPAGYVLSIAADAFGLDVRLVYGLTAVSIAPDGAGPIGAPGAPIGLAAVAWAANGTPSPLGPTFAWQLNGTGWSFDGETNLSTVFVTAAAGAEPAVVTVTASIELGQLSSTSVRASVTVVAVSTGVEAGSESASETDVGVPLAFSITAIGAPGYAYRATVEPGPGEPAAPLACTAGPERNGSLTIGCAGNASFAAAGTALPTATVTNGFSSASWSFGTVVVNPAPQLQLTPAAPVGYAGTPIAVTATVANRTGTPPYGPACLTSTPSGAICDSSSGPSWTFEPTFGAPGNFTATVSVVDDAGSNVSAAVTVRVVEPLGLGPIGPSSANVTVGSSLTLRAVVSGGVLPLRFWWNASGSVGPLLDGSVATDGSLALQLAPNATGEWVVTLTVVDRLGSFESSELAITVGPPAAARVVPIAGPFGGTTTAGAEVAVVWEAFGAGGSVDPSFATEATIGLLGTVGTPLGNVSAPGVGALTPLANGTYGVPSAAWVAGYLTADVTVRSAGPLSITLVGLGLPGPVQPVNLSVAPDREQLRLSDPSIARAGARSNATLWRATDRYGNAVPGAVVTIELDFGAVRDDRVVSAVTVAGGASGVWVNYSAPGPGAGTVTVVDAAGDVLLGPIAVPAVPPSPGLDPAVTTLAAIGPAGAAGSVAFAVVRRRRRRRTGDAGEGELRALAEGRARTVELIGDAGSIDLAGLEAAWGRSAPPALADWVASLVADGTVQGTIGPDGRPRFCLAERPPPAPRVTVDAAALDRSLRRRDAALGGDDEGPGTGRP